ncbi:protein-L-isoaspartate(D-aspartate) O-methyltransferase [Maritalea sp.]|uniref:protein-L-isoaspartate(D-aspartate) O-methyltransferase n=1 Tax=Maritalea sp. TaxID=2003361 RepID=UPI003EF680B1
MADEDQNLDWARASLVLQARQSGIMNAHILKALETVPRELFVPAEYIEHAYRDVSLPIAEHQSMISPIKLAKMFNALELEERPIKVLEVGTGSGYSAALLAQMCKRVFTVERHRSLSRAAAQSWKRLKISNIIEHHGDGLDGWALQSPFPRIILTGSVSTIPASILEQLEEGGTLVAAVGEPKSVQKITKFTKVDGELDQISLGEIRLQPLVPGKV